MIFKNLNNIPVLSQESDNVNMNEIRYVLTGSGIVFNKDDYREDRYYDKYRIRKLVTSDGTKYYKIMNSEAGKSTKVIIEISKSLFNNKIKDIPLLHIRMDAHRPTVDGIRIFMERVTVINTGLSFYSTEYEFAENFSHIDYSTYEQQLLKIPGITDVKSYGELSLLKLSLTMLIEYL